MMNPILSREDKRKTDDALLMCFTDREFPKSNNFVLDNPTKYKKMSIATSIAEGIVMSRLDNAASR